VTSVGDDYGGRSAAVEHICGHEYTLWMLFLGSSMGLVLNIPAVVFLEPGTGSQVIAMVNMFGLVGFFVFSLTFLWRCRRGSFFWS
jgi:hypothetical protein